MEKIKMRERAFKKVRKDQVSMTELLLDYHAEMRVKYTEKNNDGREHIFTLFSKRSVQVLEASIYLIKREITSMYGRSSLSMIVSPTYHPTTFPSVHTNSLATNILSSLASSPIQQDFWPPPSILVTRNLSVLKKREKSRRQVGSTRSFSLNAVPASPMYQAIWSMMKGRVEER